MRFVFLVLLVLVSCRPTPVKPTLDAPLEVSPAVLDFGQVYLGQHKTLAVTLRNPGQSAKSVQVDAVAPFSNAPRGLTLAGGDELSVDVTATPTVEGPVVTTLRVADTDVELRLAAAPVPTCASANPCEDSQFDFGLDACSVQVRADGVTCATSCVANGRCAAGVCLGVTASCDDQNPCTTDACGATGCLHLPLECAPADDPCQAAYCDSASGCQKRPVEDGTRCGRDDCAQMTARVCITGTCVTRQRPQGQLCFETLVGVAAGPGRVDARAEDARFQGVRSAATDHWGNTWVFGGGEVRRVTPGGVVTTIIHRSSAPSSPVLDGVGTGTFVNPALVTTDAFGSAWFLDSYGACLRRVTHDGVLSTVNGDCSVTQGGRSFEALAVLADGRAVVAKDGWLNRFVRDGGLEPLRPGKGPLGEAPAGELLFSDEVSDGGRQMFALSSGGATRVVRDWPSATGPDDAPLFNVQGVGASGDMLVRYQADGGCLFAVSRPDGGLGANASTPIDCWYGSPNVSTLTGSPVFFTWLGRDGQALLFDRGVALRRIDHGGYVDLAGATEQPGTADGPAGRLSVTAGFGFTVQVNDALAMQPDGSVLLADYRGQALRTWSEGPGLHTLDAGQVRITTIQPADGGFWVKSETSLRWLAGESLGPPLQLAPTLATWTPSSESQLYFEPGVGSWLFDRELLMRLDATHEAITVFRGARTVHDGPLPPLNPDGGWTDTDPDAGTADFGNLHAPVELSPGRVALLDMNAVRVLSASGFQTLAGAAERGYVDGPAALARFDGPLGLARAPNGDLYIADTENNAVRVLTMAGQVRTVGRLTDRPAGITIAPNGDVYVLVRHALLRGR